MTRLLFACALLLCLPLVAGNMISGSTTCPTSGVKAVTSTQSKGPWFVIMASPGNTGKIYVGGSNVSSTTGVYLNAGDSLSGPPQGNTAAYDLNKTYFACSVNTDSVQYIQVQ